MARRGQKILIDEECLLERNQPRMKGEARPIKGSVKMGKTGSKNAVDRARGSAKDRPYWQRHDSVKVNCTQKAGVMTRAQKRKACMEDATDSWSQRYPIGITCFAGRPGANKVARICPPDPRSRPSFIEEYSDSDSDSDGSYSSKPMNNTCSERVSFPRSFSGGQEKSFKPSLGTEQEVRAASAKGAAELRVPVGESGGLTVRAEQEGAAKALTEGLVPTSQDNKSKSSAGALHHSCIDPFPSVCDLRSEDHPFPSVCDLRSEDHNVNNNRGGVQLIDVDQQHRRLEKSDADRRRPKIEVIEISCTTGSEMDEASDQQSLVVEVSHSSIPMVRRDGRDTTLKESSGTADTDRGGGLKDRHMLGRDGRDAALKESSGTADTNAGGGLKDRHTLGRDGRDAAPKESSGITDTNGGAGGLKDRQRGRPLMITKRSASGPQDGVPIRKSRSQWTAGETSSGRHCSLTFESKGHGAYDEDIFRNLLLREKSRRISSCYLGTHQPDIHPEHRKIMVNWLVEFSSEFGLQLETLFLGVAIMDRCLAEGPALRRQMLQLLGVASMLVASKYEETQPPTMILQDCCEVADHTFTQQQILKMETTVLKILHFECAMPTVMTFLWHFLKTAKADKRLARTAEHIACLSMMDDVLLRSPPSVVAAAVVFLAAHTLNREPWSTSMTEWSGYSALDLRHCVERLHAVQMDKEVRTGNLTAIWDKYSAADHLSVALLPPMKRLPSCLYQEDESLSVQGTRR